MSDKDNKRKGDGRPGGKPKKGKYFSSGAAKKEGGIPLGTRGVLVSCVQEKENQAAFEAVSLLTEAMERLRPGKTAAAAAPPPADTSDISALIASEVADLKDASKQSLYWHSTGVNSVVYVELKDADAPSPTELVTEVCREAKASGQAKSRFVNRLYPMEAVCFASMEKMGELAERVVAQHFGEGAPPTTFAVQYDHRATPKLDRMKVINLFAERIKPPHKVNLASPDKTILVNLLKNACGVAVVQQYKELAKFNVHMLTHPPEEEEEGGGGKQAAEGAAAAAGGADGGAAAAGGEGGVGQEGEQQEEQQEQQQQEEQPAQAGAGA